MPPKKTAGKGSTARAGSARSGGGTGRRTTAAGGTRARATGSDGAAEPGPFQPGFAPECMACPFGVFFYVVKNTRPDVMEHLMRGGYELFQAFRAMTEQVGERWESADKLEHITIS